MLLTLNSYADFVAATKAVSNKSTVLYDIVTGGGNSSLLSISGVEKVYIFVSLSSSQAPTSAQVLADFPTAVALANGFNSPTTP
jgi:hypothetical protein